MPPKAKVTKEEIVSAAVDLVRREGASALNARTLALCLQCSTQPIFSNFSSMEQLRMEVLCRANALCEQRIQREQEEGKYPLYKAAGMAYIHFAKEERELFRLLYMRDRTRDESSFGVEFSQRMQSVVEDATGLEGDVMQLFHLEMWACVHGIASMLATGFFPLEEDLISKILTDCYQGLRKQFQMEG